jgi:flagella basal body P-ring formation protein FlgA
MITLNKARIPSSLWVKPKALGLAFICGVVSIGSLYAAEINMRPVPNITIYPGQSINESWITEREFTVNFLAARGFLIENRSGVIGKVARRTLLPGLPIPGNAVGEPKVVLSGAKVKVVYEEDGLVITAYGSALQAGGVGDLVSVRNTDSGVTIIGLIQSDGSVRVSGS